MSPMNSSSLCIIRKDISSHALNCFVIYYHWISPVVAFAYSGRIGDVTEPLDIDYLAIGHASLDVIPGGSVPGGTVTYAARVAQALGCRVAVLTSVSSNFDIDSAFPGIAVHNIPARTTTTFENRYADGQRHQKLYDVAESIGFEDVPEVLKRVPIVHIGPIANEIDPAIISLFSNSIVGLTPQGWFRRWDENGLVFEGRWAEADKVLPMAAAVILSREDVSEQETLEEFRRRARVLVLTEQAGGCTVFCKGERRSFKAPSVREINPTGAGDTFAAAYLIRLYQTRGNPWEAAEFANRIASASVTRKTLEGKVEAIKTLMDSD